MLELALIIVCNGAIIAFMITGILGALSPGPTGPQQGKRKRD